MSDFKKLDALIDHLRAKGVTAYKGSLDFAHAQDRLDDQVELALLPVEPMKDESERKKSVEERLEGLPRGADGLTAEQQEELYGSVIDAPKARR